MCDLIRFCTRQFHLRAVCLVRQSCAFEEAIHCLAVTLLAGCFLSLTDGKFLVRISGRVPPSVKGWRDCGASLLPCEDHRSSIYRSLEDTSVPMFTSKDSDDERIIDVSFSFLFGLKNAALTRELRSVCA